MGARPFGHLYRPKYRDRKTGERREGSFWWLKYNDQDGKTRMDFRAQVITATPAAAGPLAGMETGWSQSLDRLSAHVAPH